MPALPDQWDFINHNNDADATKKAQLIKRERLGAVLWLENKQGKSVSTAPVQIIF